MSTTLSLLNVTQSYEDASSTTELLLNVNDITAYGSTYDVNNCFILGNNVTIPWDNPDNIIRYPVYLWIDWVKSAILVPTLYIIGLPTTIINIIVFSKQGLKEKINFCLFAMACVDLVYLTVIFVLYAERMVMPFSVNAERLGPVYRYMVNNSVVGLYGFGFAQMFLTAVISADRCLCVLFPLKAKRILSYKAIVIVVVSGVVILGFGRFFLIWATYQVSCYYEESTGRLSWQLSVKDFFVQHQELITTLNGIFYGFGITVGCPVVVTACTIVTSIKLMRTVRSRRLMTSTSSGASGGMSQKELGVTKMLIALSVQFMVLSVPSMLARIWPVFEPELKPGGKHANLDDLLRALFEFSIYIDSATNFFVYYSTGSRYRETFHRLFRCKIKLRPIELVQFRHNPRPVLNNSTDEQSTSQEWKGEASWSSGVVLTTFSKLSDAECGYL